MWQFFRRFPVSLEELLVKWARWRSIREDSGLGYAESPINRMMAGDVLTGSSCSYALPYGIDADSVFFCVESVYQSLCDIHKTIITRHYLCSGYWRDNVAAFGCSERSYLRFLRDARNVMLYALQTRIESMIITAD